MKEMVKTVFTSKKWGPFQDLEGGFNFGTAVREVGSERGAATVPAASQLSTRVYTGFPRFTSGGPGWLAATSGLTPKTGGPWRRVQAGRGAAQVRPDRSERLQDF